MNLAYLPSLTRPDGILILIVVFLLRLLPERMQQQGIEKRAEETESKRDWVVVILLSLILVTAVGLIMGICPREPGSLLMLILVMLLGFAKRFPTLAKELSALAEIMEPVVREFFRARDELEDKMREGERERSESAKAGMNRLMAMDRFAIILLCFIFVAVLGFALGRP